MNEISTWGQKMPDNVLFDYDGKHADHLQAHNVYGMQMARSSYEGALQQFKERPFILSRSGYAGIQRYSALWTGDNRAEEDHMLQGVRLLTSLGLSGVPFTAMDVGGFTGNPTISLYTRWMQIGAFIPYFRNHTNFNTKSAEPWAFGEDALDISRSYINLRYQLLPYLYSTFYESTQNGMPIMRSLAISCTFDPEIFKSDYQNQYEFGNAFMIAPFESNKEYGKVYFPEGTWYDLYKGDIKTGKQEKIIPLSISKLPVYVKGGSIIPMQALIQSTAEQPTDTLFIHIYNGRIKNEFIYYEDDGKSFAYQKGDFYKRVIVFDPEKQTITFNAAEGTYKSHFKHIELILHGFNQVTAMQSGSNQLKIQNAKFVITSTTTNTDAAGRCLQTENNNIKYTDVTTTNNIIQIHY